MKDPEEIERTELVILGPDEPKTRTVGLPVKIMGQPEYIGSLPVRTELTVLPADPHNKPVGWAVETFDGGEVTRPNSEEPLTNKDDLKPGDVVWVPQLFGVHEMTVVKDEDGELYAEDEGSFANLIFAVDRRNCWTSSAAYNKRAFEKPVNLECSKDEDVT